MAPCSWKIGDEPHADHLSPKPSRSWYKTMPFTTWNPCFVQKRNVKSRKHAQSLPSWMHLIWHLQGAHQDAPASAHTSSSAPQLAPTKQNDFEDKDAKRTTAGIPTWSPTVVLICRSTAYVWQSGRDAQFSADCGRTCLISNTLGIFLYAITRKPSSQRLLHLFFSLDTLQRKTTSKMQARFLWYIIFHLSLPVVFVFLSLST
jgi:hypothetical protein